MTNRFSCLVVGMFSCLLATATSAQAECAWVLWAKGVLSPKIAPPSSGPLDPYQAFYWEIVDAYPASEGCVSAGSKTGRGEP